eukprot:2051284-Rhodomonas_salina.1
MGRSGFRTFCDVDVLWYQWNPCVFFFFLLWRSRLGVVCVCAEASKIEREWSTGSKSHENRALHPSGIQAEHRMAIACEKSSMKDGWCRGCTLRAPVPSYRKLGYLRPPRGYLRLPTASYARYLT